jgi:hypothetical protein
MQPSLKMLFRTVAVVAVMLLPTAASAPPAQAAPATDIWTQYYDCALIWQGEKFRGCDSTGYNTGITAGYYKSVESCSCGGTTCTNSWYIWDGTRWSYIGANEPSPAC